jgi:hypothetical protein
MSRTHETYKRLATAVALAAVVAPAPALAEYSADSRPDGGISLPSSGLSADSRPDGGVTLPESSPVTASSTSDGGFDWGDAAMGAGGITLLLVAAGGTALVTQRRHAARTP